MKCLNLPGIEGGGGVAHGDAPVKLLSLCLQLTPRSGLGRLCVCDGCGEMGR